MEVIKPELYWVQDRCYRRNPSRNNYSSLLGADGKGKDSTQTAAAAAGTQNNGNGNGRRDRHFRDQESEQMKVPYEEFDEGITCDVDAPDEDEDNQKYVVESVENGFKSRATSIPASFYPLIIGAKGSTKKRLETETNTKIIVPRINEKGDIVVRGQRQRDVLSCRRRLDLMVSQARAKRDITHYACFPMNTPQVIEKFNEFKDKVLRDFGSSSRGLDENIFQTPEKLHVTISVLILLDARERDELSNIVTGLEAEVKNIVGGKMRKLNLRGLEIMNDDPSAVDVLYAKCNVEDDTLQNVANFVSNQLDATGYSKPSRGESVKLHATLINTRYRSSTVTEDDSESRYKGGDRFKRESFDARKILEKYGDFNFGSVNVSEIKVVTRHSKGGLMKDVLQTIKCCDFNPYTPLFQK